MLQPGTVYTFGLQNGLCGACRVLRLPEKDERTYQGHTLVYATKWVGDLPLDLKHGDLRKTLRDRTGPKLFWVKGEPPSGFAEAGMVTVRKSEQSKSCRSQAPWGIFPNVTFAVWESEHRPESRDQTIRAENKKTKASQEKLLVELKANETIDLTGLVPLTKPMSEREPEAIVKGFIAAMHRWEKESARVARKWKDTAPITRFNRDAQKQIFDEFCTPKERKHGRQGAFSEPPEYSPRNEKIVAVRSCSPRRVEVDTRERAGLKRLNTYVLLRKKKVWLIDSKKSNGNKSVL